MSLAGLVVLALVAAQALPASAETGVTDKEITLGQTMAYSGPASAYGNFGKAEIAHTRMVNDKGGVHGRKINLISLDDIFYTVGYMMAESVVKLLEQCGDDLTRDNVMHQVAHLDVRIPMLLPGIRLQTTPTDFYPMKSLQLERFDGKSFVLFGEPMAGTPNPQ